MKLLELQSYEQSDISIYQILTILSSSLNKTIKTT